MWGNPQFNMITLELVVALLCGMHILSMSVGEPATCLSSDGKCKMHIDKNGTQKCCREVKCRPGTQAALCDHDGCEGAASEAKCIPCPQKMYQSIARDSVAMFQCQFHRECSERKHLVEDTPASSTADRTCVCDLSMGYYIDGEGCSRYPKPCPPGEELHPSGDCKPCAEYWKYKEGNGTGRCQQKTDCEQLGQEFTFKSHHNKTVNNVCKNTSAAITVGTPLTGEVTGGGGKDLPMGAIIGGTVAGVAVIIVIIVLIIVLVVRRRSSSEEPEPLPEKTAPPEDSDNDCPPAYRRQASVDSHKQLLVANPAHSENRERPHVHIPPQRQGSGKSDASGVRTPDSGIDMRGVRGPGGLETDVEADSIPTPSPGVLDRNYVPLGGQTPLKDSTIQLVVNAPNCQIQIGTNSIIHHQSVENLDNDGGDVEYVVQEAN